MCPPGVYHIGHGLQSGRVKYGRVFVWCCVQGSGIWDATFLREPEARFRPHCPGTPNATFPDATLLDIGSTGRLAAEFVTKHD